MSDSENSKGKMRWKRNFSNKNIKKSSSNSRSRSNNSNSNSGKRRKSNSISHSRSLSSSKSNDIKKRGPALNFMFFIEKNYLLFFQSNNELVLRNIEASFENNVKIYFDSNFVVPDMEGTVIVIESQEIQKKKEALKIILDHIETLRKKENDNDHNNNEMKGLILVPNGLVSIIIGTRGKQINYLIKSSGANIIVNQPIFKMLHRTITIVGKTSKITNAIVLIYKIMEDRYFEVEHVEVESKPLDLSNTKTSAKFIYNQSCVDYLLEKNSKFLKNLEKNFNIVIKFYQEKHNKLISRNDHITYIKGRVQDVQDAILLLFNKVQYHCKEDYKGKESFNIKMLIPKIYVTKLIGVKGCMIKKLSHSSGGAMIKILSEKNREDFAHEIIVSLGGGIGQIQDAACLIIEQIECFKNGGPVLATGKSLHKNIAQQFEESIVINDKEKEDDIQKYIKKRRRSRSRSISIKKEDKKTEQKEKTPIYDNNNNQQTKTIDQFILFFDNNHKIDPSRNRSFEEKGIIKITNEIIIPDHLLFAFCGKNSDLLKLITNKSGSSVVVHEENKIKTYDNLNGKILTIKGTPSQNAQALQIISETLIKIEPIFIGDRKK